MDQNNQPSQPNQPTPPPTAATPTPPVTAPVTSSTEQITPPAPQPSQNPAQPSTPNDGHKKNHTMLFVIIGVCVLCIAIMFVYIFVFSSKKPVLTQQAPTQVSQQTASAPTPAISQTIQQEVNSVDVNQDNADIKDVQKDVNSL